MRKILALAMVALLAMTVAFAAVGCGQKTDTSTTETTTPSSETPMDTSMMMPDTSAMLSDTTMPH